MWSMPWSVIMLLSMTSSDKCDGAVQWALMGPRLNRLPYQSDKHKRGCKAIVNKLTTPRAIYPRWDSDAQHSAVYGQCALPLN